jgi:hypothetical protein
MSTLSKRAATKATACKRRGGAHGLVLLGVSFIAGCVMLPTTAGARPDAQSSAQPVAAVATLTTSDFRVAVIAQRLSAGASADRGCDGFRLRARRPRLAQAPRTAPAGDLFLADRDRAAPDLPTRDRHRETADWQPTHVTIQVLQSPSLGCGPSHRIPLPSR